jgi:phosphodiesterase/alkaline phosphatase D-like protein
VNPNGAAITECRFEYGTTTHYGQPPALCSDPSASEVGDGTSAVKVSADLVGLIPNQTYHYRLVVGNASADRKGEDSEFTTKAAPTVDEQPPSAFGITRTTAELSGTINPENSPTEYDFQYVRAAEYEPSAPNPYSTGEETSKASVGAGLIDVSAGPQALVELQPETTYDYRLVATNSAAGAEVGPDYTFTTASRTPPLVDTGAASGVTQRDATISGVLTPQGIETDYAFEVGTDTTYSGAKVSGNAGNGEGAEPIAVALTDLAPGTTYHYRLTATNADGSSYGQDMTFTAVAFPAEAGTTAATSKKALTRAQKLTMALKTCRTKKKGKRASCERQARKQYAPAKAGAKQKHNKQH